MANNETEVHSSELKIVQQPSQDNNNDYPGPKSLAFLNGKRKFWITVFVMVSGTAAFFMRILDQSGYITLMTLILSIYGTANVFDKKFGGEG